MIRFSFLFSVIWLNKQRLSFVCFSLTNIPSKSFLSTLSLPTKIFILVELTMSTTPVERKWAEKKVLFHRELHESLKAPVQLSSNESLSLPLWNNSGSSVPSFAVIELDKRYLNILGYSEVVQQHLQQKKLTYNSISITNFVLQTLIISHVSYCDITLLLLYMIYSETWYNVLLLYFALSLRVTTTETSLSLFLSTWYVEQHVSV